MKYRAETGAVLSHHWRQALIVGAAVLGLAATGVAGYELMTQSSEPASLPESQTTVHSTELQSKPEALESNILFVGDVFWGRSVQTRAEASPLRYKYPTSGLDRSNWDNYDAHIGNFECPITNNIEPVSTQIDVLKFNCRPEFLPNLAKWFTAGGQANNHTMNQDGQTGLLETRQHLEKAGIQYFGNYDMNQTDDICEVIEAPATTATTHQKTSLPLAMCSYMYVVDATPTDAQLAVMQRYAKVMPVIAFPHMGVEFRDTAEPEKVSAYHRMIDNGADAVIGAHPHVIQNSESYKGRLIAYSLGNFLFDQQSLGQDTTLGLAVGLKLTITDEQAAKVYEQVAPSCSTYKDDCVAELAARLTQRPQIKVEYTFSCYDESTANGRVPRLGSKTTCDAVRRQATLGKLSMLSSRW
jgi:poly-gamma-glutamate synthesis protein (capsule biosynthesis protein)